MTKEEMTGLCPKNFDQLVAQTGNIYQTTTMIAQRAKYIALRTKEQLTDELAAFIVPDTNSLEETIESDERLAIVERYEKQPKPTVIATREFIANS